MNQHSFRDVRHDTARREFIRSLRWIALAGLVVVGVSLYYVSLFGELTVAAVLLTTTAVFLSMLLGCGLFAAAFFSDKSGHDEEVTNATDARLAAQRSEEQSVNDTHP